MTNEHDTLQAEHGLQELIDFVDTDLAPRYGDKLTAAIISEFARLTPRTVLAMASPSTPEAYGALRDYFVESLQETAKEVAKQEPISEEDARKAFELLFMPPMSKTVQ